MVRKRVNLKIHATSDLILKKSLASHQPERQQESIREMKSEKSKTRLPQRICPYECSVEIDAQRNPGLLSRHEENITFFKWGAEATLCTSINHFLVYLLKALETHMLPHVTTASKFRTHREGK